MGLLYLYKGISFFKIAKELKRKIWRDRKSKLEKKMIKEMQENKERDKSYFFLK